MASVWEGLLVEVINKLICKFNGLRCQYHYSDPIFDYVLRSSRI